MTGSGEAIAVRYALPQPYRDLDHTADAGVEVEGASADEALARLVLAEAALLAGGATVEVEREEQVREDDGGDAGESDQADEFGDVVDQSEEVVNVVHEKRDTIPPANLISAVPASPLPGNQSPP